MTGRPTLRLVGADPRSAAPERHGAVSPADTAAFHALRPRLLGIAYRVIGDFAEAEDVVQDAWIRWQMTDRGVVRDATAFLVATATRLARNVVQSARARRETSVKPQLVEPVDAGLDPSDDLERREELEAALRAVLEKLSPTERAAYVLREAFGYRYRELGAMLALTEPNARQVVTRARRHLAEAPRRLAGAAEHEQLVDVFQTAARAGEIAPLERLLGADAAPRLAA